jgi:hypothetical protein
LAFKRILSGLNLYFFIFFLEIHEAIVQEKAKGGEDLKKKEKRDRPIRLSYKSPAKEKKSSCNC